MSVFHRLRAVRVVAGCLGAAAVLVCAARAEARPAAIAPPPNWSIDPGWQGTVDLVWQQIPKVVRAVAADLDADGDLDVIAVTEDQPIVVWINDGKGHLVRRAPLSPAGGFEARTGEAARPMAGTEVPQSDGTSVRWPGLRPAELWVLPRPRLAAVLDSSACFNLADACSPPDSRGPPSPLCN